MKIEKIVKNKNNYTILFDNGDKIKTYDEVIINNNLLFHKEVNDDILKKIMNDTTYYDSYYKIIKFVNRKLRSEFEINNYIDKLQITNKDKIIKELKNKKIINDNLFIKAFIQDKINLTNDGPIKIKKELLEHNIDEEIINNELEVFLDELKIEKINKVINKMINSNKNKSVYLLKQKIMTNLINMGYLKEDVLFELNKYNLNDDAAIKKEYDLLYKKLSKKYNNEELMFQIKNKLYQKGYSTDSINNIIE